jgi:uncharacterized protein (TIGR02391 family)
MDGAEDAAPKSARDLLEIAKAIDAELAGAGLRAQVPTAPVATEQPGAVAQILNRMDLFDGVVTDPDLVAVTRPLFRDGYYARAVEEAFKFLDNAVRGRSGVTNKSGRDLMLHVFSVDQPVLRLSRLRSQSEKDEQEGYRFMFTGVMAGLRNPRAHEHALQDDQDAALEMLVTANHLVRTLRRSTRVRRARRMRTGTANP